MKCPSCSGSVTVIDSRPAGENSIRRRRKCLVCDRRFSTYETAPSDAEEDGYRPRRSIIFVDRSTERVIGAAGDLLRFTVEVSRANRSDGSSPPPGGYLKPRVVVGVEFDPETRALMVEAPGGTLTSWVVPE